jgi:hypothetical protein
VNRVFAASSAELLDFKLATVRFLVAFCRIVPVLASVAAQKDYLSHITYLLHCFSGKKTKKHRMKRLVKTNHAEKARQTVARAFFVEPTTRIELVTFCLPCKCSTD